MSHQKTLSLGALAAILLSTTALADALPDDVIVVTANRISTPVTQLGSAVSVVTADDLANQQILSVYDAMRQLPGVSVTDTGGHGGVTSVFLRGFDTTEVKVLIDGIEVADPSATSSVFDFADLLTAEIDRIEIVRGPQSTLYGSDAMGGVINIITKSGKSDPGNDVALEGGSYGTVDGDGSMRGMIGQLDYAAGIAGMHTDGIIAADARNGNHDLDPYDNLTASLKLGLPIGDLVDVGAVFRYVDSAHPYPGFSFTTELPADAPGQSQAVREIFGRVQIHARLFDGRLENTLGANLAETDRDYLQDDVVQSYFRGRSEVIDDQATLKILPWLAAIAGGETNQEHYKDDSGFTAEKRTDSFYGELTVTPIPSLALTGGFRTDQVENGAGATTYRFTGSYQPLPAGPRLHASYGTGFKAPSLYQLFIQSPFVVGDPRLKAETSTGRDAGMEQRLPFGHTIVDATYFANDIRNLIDGFSDADFVFHYANTNHAQTQGLETSLTTHPVETVEFKASYTWLRTHDLTDGGELIRRPHHTVSATATWIPTDPVQVFTTVTWIGAQNDDDFQPGAPPIIRLPSYTLLSFGGSYRINDRISLTARMENALDRHYEEVFGYGTAGRAAYLGVKTSF